MKLARSLFMVIFFLWGACTTKEEPFATMPMPVANNAVVSANVEGNDYIYSFGGIDATKESSGITLRSFKYSVSENIWSEIDPLPDTMPKIASAASVVNGLIYIIGGYHVFPDGSERSSAKVHVYDPAEERYLKDGPDLPTPIDDQVQAVWNDSLIYVVTGWSDSLNINQVQVFDPGGHWHYATSLPDEYPYKVFGSSGVIIDNTIYYLGGAGNRREKNFPVQNALRIGKINPENPLAITWSEVPDDKAGIYRPASLVVDGRPYWIGGSKKSYNYNGIAYTGEPVEPAREAVYYDTKRRQLSVVALENPGVMDLRGAGLLQTGEVILIGGMLSQQVVSDKVFRINLSSYR